MKPSCTNPYVFHYINKPVFRETVENKEKLEAMRDGPNIDNTYWYQNLRRNPYPVDRSAFQVRKASTSIKIPDVMNKFIQDDLNESQPSYRPDYLSNFQCTTVIKTCKQVEIVRPQYFNKYDSSTQLFGSKKLNKSSQNNSMLSINASCRTKFASVDEQSIKDLQVLYRLRQKLHGTNVYEKELLNLKYDGGSLNQPYTQFPVQCDNPSEEVIVENYPRKAKIILPGLSKCMNFQ